MPRFIKGEMVIDAGEACDDCGARLDCIIHHSMDDMGCSGMITSCGGYCTWEEYMDSQSNHPELDHQTIFARRVREAKSL